MATATLSARERGDVKVSYEQLAQIEPPAPMGPRHVPVRHSDLVGALREAVAEHHFSVGTEEYAIGREGARLFGVMTIKPTEGDTLVAFPEEMGMAIGIRHANDMSHALKIVTGAVVFVCSNLQMYGHGDGTEFRKLHTRGLNLKPVVGMALEDAFAKYVDFNQLVGQLKEVSMTDLQAKELIYNVFTHPDRPFPYAELRDVHNWYFVKPREDESLTDVAPRTAWGISNAFTRVIREQSLGRQIGSSVKIMRLMKKLTGVN